MSNIIWKKIYYFVYSFKYFNNFCVIIFFKLYKLVSVYGNTGFTSEGAIYQTFTNKTGTSSVKGNIVVASTTTDNAVGLAHADSSFPIGIIYESGIADGSPVKVVVYGRAQVLLQNTTAAVHGYWCGVSSTAGRMFQSATVPSVTEHTKEIGHCLESKDAGTDVLAWVQVHFN